MRDVRDTLGKKRLPLLRKDFITDPYQVYESRAYGADSLLLLLPSQRADFGMRIFDTDGSEAEACGNGLRCLARYLFEKGLIAPGADRITVETLSGIREVRLEQQGDRLIKIQANMGKPGFHPDDIPVTITPGEGRVVDIKSMVNYPVRIDGTEISLNLVSMGNPHAVCFWDQPVANFPLSQLGPKVEKLTIFPKRTNFEVARVINRQQIELRTWERGVGETLACGTGACATLVAATLGCLVGREAVITLPGGDLLIRWHEDEHVYMTGPATEVFEGVVDLPSDHSSAGT